MSFHNCGDAIEKAIVAQIIFNIKQVMAISKS